MPGNEAFIQYFRSRHGWRCRLGSVIHADLTAFAIEQVASAHSPEDLYVLFCVTNGIKPKPATSAALQEGKE